MYIRDPIQRYRSCCDRFSIWVHLSLKYEQTADKSILLRILSALFEQSREETETLFQFHQTCMNLQKERWSVP